MSEDIELKEVKLNDVKIDIKEEESAYFVRKDKD